MTKKRFLSIFVALCLSLAMFPATALAEEDISSETEVPSIPIEEGTPVEPAEEISSAPVEEELPVVPEDEDIPAMRADELPTEATCGDGLTWKFEVTAEGQWGSWTEGTLTISGNGANENYTTP